MQYSCLFYDLQRSTMNVVNRINVIYMQINRTVGLLQLIANPLIYKTHSFICDRTWGEKTPNLFGIAMRSMWWWLLRPSCCTQICLLCLFKVRRLSKICESATRLSSGAEHQLHFMYFVTAQEVVAACK